MKLRFPAVVGLLMLALSPIATGGDATDVTVSNAWIREAPPGVAMLAGYMLLQNPTTRPQVLLAARSAGFETVMIHRTMVRDGVAGMKHAPLIELAPGTSLLFSPGGYHLMLSKPKQPLRVGDRIDVYLEFRGGRVLPVAFEVRK